MFPFFTRLLVLGRLLLYMRSPKGGCYSILDGLSCSSHSPLQDHLYDAYLLITKRLHNSLFVSESFAMGKLHKDTAIFITNLVAEGRAEEDIIQVAFSWKPIYLDVYTVLCVNILGVKCHAVTTWLTLQFITLVRANRCGMSVLNWK